MVGYIYMYMQIYMPILRAEVASYVYMVIIYIIVIMVIMVNLFNSL